MTSPLEPANEAPSAPTADPEPAAPPPPCSESASKHGQQWVLSALYVLILAFCMYMVIHSDNNPKVALAWIIAGVVASQVVVDLGNFSSPKIKGRFSAAFRVLSGVFVLLAAYKL